MITVRPFQKDDRQAIVGFVAAIQEHERTHDSDLKVGTEIGSGYADLLLQTAASQNGSVMVACVDGQPIGFICAWVEVDEDPLLQDQYRQHAYVSDIYVDPKWRRRGVATMLVDVVEKDMVTRGCPHIRVCSKATNSSAIEFYRAAGFQSREIVFSKDLQP
jgi:ribosomal protein S18 acetylase RimI-like enzyme